MLKKLQRKFSCSHTWDDGATEEWESEIFSIENYGSYCEINVLSRSSLHLIFGKYAYGFFACAPAVGGTYLSSRLDDVFYNTERLSHMYGNFVDGLTMANALAIISSEVIFS